MKKFDSDENPMQQLKQEQKIVAEQMEGAILSILLKENGSIPVTELAERVSKVCRNRVCFQIKR